MIAKEKETVANEPASAGNSTIKAKIQVRAETSGWDCINPKELWRWHELVYFLVLRDLKLRYKQTMLGVTWTVLQPLLATGILTLFFGKIAKLPSDGVPYPLFCFAGLLLWNLFSNSVSRGTTSVLGNAHIIGKIYFPRILLLIAALLPGIIDFIIGFASLLIACWSYGYLPTLRALWEVPLLIAVLLTFAFSLSLWLCALAVRYRDILNILPFGLQLGMYATPILYPSHLVLSKAGFLIFINPLIPLTGELRHVLLRVPGETGSLAPSLCLSAVLLASGLTIFRRMERLFADAI